MLRDGAGPAHKKREKRKRKIEHESPRAGSQPPSHQGLGLKSKSLAADNGDAGQEQRSLGLSGKKTPLRGYWARELPQIGPAFPSWMGRDWGRSDSTLLLAHSPPSVSNSTGQTPDSLLLQSPTPPTLGKGGATKIKASGPTLTPEHLPVPFPPLFPA